MHTKKNTLLDRSKLLATIEDLTKIKNLQSNTNVIELCTRERANTQWKFYTLTKFACFAASLTHVPLGCKDTVLKDSQMKNQSAKCLTFEENTRKPYIGKICHFRSLASHLNGTERHEKENSKLFNLFLEKTGGTDPANLRVVCLKDIAAVEDIVGAGNFLYDNDVLDGSVIGELARRSVLNHSNTLSLLRYNSHLCHFSKINALFEIYRCPSCEHFIKSGSAHGAAFENLQKRIEHDFPKNVLQRRETLFDKLDSFNIPYIDDQKFF